jgi:hypothetical protein
MSAFDSVVDKIVEGNYQTAAEEYARLTNLPVESAMKVVLIAKQNMVDIARQNRTNVRKRKSNERKRNTPGSSTPVT